MCAAADCKAFAVFARSVMLPFVLFSHHSVLVLGTTKYLQFVCPWQKQPCTNITVLYFDKIRLPVGRQCQVCLGVFYRVANTGSHAHVKISVPAFGAWYPLLLYNSYYNSVCFSCACLPYYKIISIQ